MPDSAHEPGGNDAGGMIGGMQTRTKLALAGGGLTTIAAVLGFVALSANDEHARRQGICEQAFSGPGVANCVAAWEEISAADCRGPRVTNRPACLASVEELERQYVNVLWARVRARVASEAVVDQSQREHGYASREVDDLKGR